MLVAVGFILYLMGIFGILVGIIKFVPIAIVTGGVSLPILAGLPIFGVFILLGWLCLRKETAETKDRIARERAKPKYWKDPMSDF